MGRQELNIEIQRILSSFSEENLHSILQYLKEFQKIDNDKLLISKNLGKILREDSELLKRLAQ